MIIKSEYKNLFISFGLVLLWASIILISFSSNDQGLGKEFNYVVMVLFTRWFALLAGCSVLILRVLKIIKDKKSLAYVFPGVLNVSLGLLGLILVLSNNMSASISGKFNINMLLGAVILVDFLISTIGPKSKNRFSE